MLMWRLWISTAVQQTYYPPSTHPLTPQSPPNAFPEAPPEAVTVRPLVGNFLWSAGNNLTWGLSSTESRARAHLQWASLSPEDLTSATAREEHHFKVTLLSAETWNVLKVKIQFPPSLQFGVCSLTGADTDNMLVLVLETLKKKKKSVLYSQKEGNKQYRMRKKKGKYQHNLLFLEVKKKMPDCTDQEIKKISGFPTESARGSQKRRNMTSERNKYFLHNHWDKSHAQSLLTYCEIAYV